MITPTESTVATPASNKVLEIDKVKPLIVDQIDHTKVVGRENEVLTNLNNAYASGMKTPEAIRSFADYNNASPEKKLFVDDFIA